MGSVPSTDLVVASTDLVVASTDLVVASTDLVVASTDLVVASTDLVVASTDLVVASTDLVVASTDLVVAVMDSHVLKGRLPQNVTLSVGLHQFGLEQMPRNVDPHHTGHHSAPVGQTHNPCTTGRERERERERNVLFNNALNTFYLRLYGVRHMVKDHSDSEKGNPLLPHRLLLSINSKASFICTIPQTG